MIMKFSLLAVFISLAFAVQATAQNTKPNVLFIVCDDLNTHVSTSGYEAIKTPTLAAFAKEAMSFDRAFCQYPVCGPSRASFLHGLYPESTGVLNNTVDIRKTRPNTISLPQHFKQNGYWTAGVGKIFHNTKHQPGDVAWHENHKFENDELPVAEEAKQRFEEEFGSVEARKNVKKWKAARKIAIAPLNAQTPPGHGRSGLKDEQHKDGKNVRQVTTWLREKSFGDKPFFIALGIQKPHVPFLAPDKYFDLYPANSIPFHRDPVAIWDTLPRDAMAKRFTAFGFELGKENVARRQEFMQAYHACISFIDAQIATVFQQLKDQGLWEDTIIVFTSDHGYHLGDHFLWGKVTLFDVGAKVPFMMRVPGMTQSGSRSDAMVELVDLFPTLTELTNLRTPPHLQGSSLVPVLKDPAQTGPKSHAYSVVSRGENLGYAIRDQNWRYGKWPSGGEELYNLNSDPHERNNLANDPRYTKRLAEWRAALDTKQKKAQANRQAK